jgi:hypothetical protein
LNFEAVLTSPESYNSPQAGRPYTVTDPNPPITYGDLYLLLRHFTITGVRMIPVPPMLVLLPSYPIEWYSILLAKYPILGKILPQVSGDLKYLKPALFAITTHLVASNKDSGRPVSDGGLGYKGVLTTIEGMTQEVIEWNHEHADTGGKKKVYLSSVSLAEEIQKHGHAGSTVAPEVLQWADS